MRFLTPHLLLGSLFLAGPGWIACSKSDPEAPVGQRVENSSLGIAIAAVPAPFVVWANDGPALELRAPGDAGEAILFVEATGEIGGGINLIAEAEGIQDWFEQQPGGQYFGNLELGTPLGPAFTSRGAYVLDGVEVEELRVFAIHPTSNRILRLTYRYGPGEGKERMEQLAEVLGEVEALDNPDQDASSAASEC